MVSILQYPFITPYTFAISFIENESILSEWLLNGRVAENPIVEPTNNTIVVQPSAKNRYLETVSVSNRFPRVYTTNIAVDSTVNISVPGATVADTDDSTLATATASNYVVSVKGVAAGTTVIRAYNSGDILVGLIVATVSE